MSHSHFDPEELKPPPNLPLPPETFKPTNGAAMCYANPAVAEANGTLNFNSLSEVSDQVGVEFQI